MDGPAASSIMRSGDTSPEERLSASFKILHDFERDPDDLFYSHLILSTTIIEKEKIFEWGQYILGDLSELFSTQWAEKAKFPAMLKTPLITVPQINQACNSTGIGKPKIGQILLAASQAVSVRIPSEVFSQIRTWAEDRAMNHLIKYTYQDYLNTPEDKRYELLDGDLVMSPSPGKLHQSISAQLGWRLVQFTHENQLGQVYHAPFDVILSNIDVVQPDLVFVSQQHQHLITSDNIQGPPDLVVQILSPSTGERDRTFKRTLYAKHGVNEYWIVDPEAVEILVFLFGQGGYKIPNTYRKGDTLTTTTIEGFRLNISDIF